ncbi:hypothetical protein E1294_48645 [Nonomuraea diastatica]|uniref:Tn3 transposase DDE domain-containing protein n=1 Tax=Nonomuraea diastatica TaxID=1848329 RepID=A0A4R4VLV0_9ACTN|nr:hypothetical protein E1294_48645 [Nonomuraea diastatica]
MRDLPQFPRHCRRRPATAGRRLEDRTRSLAEVSPYLTEHIMRFGEYSTHELAITPEAYEPHLDIDFTRLHDGLAAA